MKYEKLIDVAPPSGKRVTKYLGEKQYLSTGSLKVDSLLMESVTYDNKPTRADIYVYEGDVLFARMKNTKKVLLIEEKTNGIIVSTGYSVNHPDEKKLYGRYLVHYLKSSNFQKQKDKFCTGAIQTAITNEGLKKISIPLPPVENQMRIANILDRAENLIDKRKTSISMCDEFIKNTFLQMFGFANTNYKQWEVEPLSMKTEIVSGVTKGKKHTSDKLLEIPYMRVANVQDGYLDLSEIKVIEVTDEEIQLYRLRKGDLLLTEGGDPDKLGRGAVWDDEIDVCIHQNHIFRVRVQDGSISPIYLSGLMGSRYGKRYFLKVGKQTTGIATINSTQLKNFPLVKPPISLQNHYASLASAVKYIKIGYARSLAELQNLYETLSHLAFKGELDLSRVPVNFEPKLEVVKKKMNMDDFTSIPQYRFTDKDIDKLTKKFIGKAFTFEDLWIEIEAQTYREKPSRGEIQNKIITLLESDESDFHQVFEAIPAEKNMKDMISQIAFRGNYEN